MPWVINGMSWTTYRNRPEPYLDEALEITGKRIRATEWLMDNSDWDLMASVWVSVDRTQHALSNYVAPDHPDYREEREDRDRREGARRLQAARRRDRLVRLAHAARRPRPVHLGPRVPVGHAHDPHGPPAEAVRLPRVQRVERGLRADAVGAGAQGRAQGLRHARPAREGLAAAVGELVQDQGVHDDPLDGRGRLDQPGRARARRHRRPGRFREGARPGDGRALELRRPEDRPQAREGDLPARGDLQGQARRHGARHPDGAGRAVLAHAREDRDRGRRLDLGRPPASRA